MDLNEYQDHAELTAIYPPEKALEYLALGLVSEAGEVAGKVKKIIRDGENPGWNHPIADELGDVLWYVAMLADQCNYSLSGIARENLQKLANRQERGVLGGTGDMR